MPDGRQIPQFDSEGKKLKWNDLPDKPVSILLVPFSKDLALKVRAVSKEAALPIEAMSVELHDLGDGLLCGIDQQFHTTPTVKCLSCGHMFPFNPSMKAECPACHDKDEWFCTRCQEKREPFVVGDKTLCPDCSQRGTTTGLQRVKKFVISAGGMSYDFQHWIRSGNVEVRIANGKVSVHTRQPAQTEDPVPEPPQ
jgi:predicted RNA-binding Zn-ribbon protein involved in translation (DUF1610 family)